MSRTDKDRPHWVRARDAEPHARFVWHYWRCEESTASYVPLERRERCDLDSRRKGRCIYYESFRSTRSGPPRWWRNARWFNPERNGVRMDCDRAAKEYRGSGDTDVIPSICQHHHGASWDWY